MKRKNSVVIVFILVMGLFTCTSSDVKCYSNRNQQVLFTHQQYQDICNKLYENLNIQGYEVKASTKGGNLTSVDKDVTFNKRRLLCLNSEAQFDENGTIILGPNIKTTQEFIILENKDQSSQINIGIYYTSQYIGNDMIGSSSNDGYKQINQQLANKNNLAILSYHNLLISLQHVSLNEVDDESTNNILRSIIYVLEN